MEETESLLKISVGHSFLEVVDELWELSLPSFPSATSVFWSSALALVHGYANEAGLASVSDFLSPRFAVVCRSHRRCRPLLARFGPALGKGRGLRPTQALECRRVVHLVPRAPLRAPDLVDAGIVRPLCLRFEYRRLRFVHRRLRFQGCPLCP